MMDEKRDGGVLLLLHTILIIFAELRKFADEDTHRVSRHFDHLVLTPPATAAEQRAKAADDHNHESCIQGVA